MIPGLQSLAGSPWKVLPPGIHSASLDEIVAVFGSNPRRRQMCDGLVLAAKALAKAGCKTLIFDGSFVTGNPTPREMPGD